MHVGSCGHCCAHVQIPSVGAACRNFVGDRHRGLAWRRKRISNIELHIKPVRERQVKFFSSDASFAYAVNSLSAYYDTVVQPLAAKVNPRTPTNAFLYKVEIERYATRRESLIRASSCDINAFVRPSIYRTPRPPIRSSFRIARPRRSMCACV